MAKRTLFYPRPLISQGTGATQSLRSYIERLALDHNMKPRGLLKTLLEQFPLDGLRTDLHTLFNKWSIHGFAEVGGQIEARLEQATGVALTGSTLSRFAGLLSATNLTRTEGAVYCPCCVGESEEELPYGRLLWEVQCVTACPVHRVKLRSAKDCGASPSERLPVARRPSLNGVCTRCGSVGFKCIAEEPCVATDEEVWVAEQVQRLIALPPEAVSRCSSESFRRGLVDLVKQCYGGSVVRASEEAGLSRSSVCTWVAGNFTPGLPWLLQLCFHADADVCALLDGFFKSLNPDADERVKRRPLEVVHRTYNQTELTDVQIRELLVEAAKEPEPPSPSELARRHGLNEDAPRRRFPEESSRLAAANAQYMERVYEGRYVEAVDTYTSAAQALLQQGKTVHAKSLQKQSGLIAFSQNRLRVRALSAVMERFQSPPSAVGRRGVAGSTASSKPSHS